MRRWLPFAWLGLMVVQVQPGLASASTDAQSIGAGRGSATVYHVAQRARRGTRRQRGDRFRLGGSLTVGADEVVRGDVVVVGGRAIVQGEVRGSVTAVAGRLTLGPESEVDGDVTVVGGRFDRHPDARIGGDLNEVILGVADVDFHMPSVRWPSWSGMTRLPRFLGSVGRLLLLGFLVCLVVALAPGTVARVGDRAAATPWLAGFLGLTAQILFVPMVILTVVILVVSIIGIPFLLFVPLLLVGVALATLVGFAGVVQRSGRWVEGRLGASGSNRYRAAIVGLLAISSLVVAGRLIGVVGGIFALVAVVLMASGFVVEFVVWTVGVGALLLEAFGPRPAPAGPPPLPPDPSPPDPATPPPPRPLLPAPTSGPAQGVRPEEEPPPIPAPS